MSSAPPVAVAATAPTAPPGSGSVVIQRVGDRSTVTRAFATSPLRLLTPANHGHAAWIYTSSYGGGMVDGDRVRLNIVVGDNAAAFVSTQALTKVYRSPRGTCSELDAHVRRNALLVLAPDPVVCFARARYRQHQAIALATGASLVLVDWMSSGRWGSGERWRFDEYIARLRIGIDGRPVVHDALSLRADEGELAARMGRFETFATVVLAGPLVRDAAAAIVGDVNAAPLCRRARQLTVASALGEHGCIVRIAGASVEEVGTAMHAMLAFVPDLLGDDPWRHHLRHQGLHGESCISHPEKSTS